MTNPNERIESVIENTVDAIIKQAPHDGFNNLSVATQSENYIEVNLTYTEGDQYPFLLLQEAYNNNKDSYFRRNPNIETDWNVIIDGVESDQWVTMNEETPLHAVNNLESALLDVGYDIESTTVGIDNNGKVVIEILLNA